MIVIDQSDDNTTEEAMRPLIQTGRIFYEKIAGKGLAAARNYALGMAQAEVIAFTDDDCVVSPGWLSGMLKALHDHPYAAIVFGNVLPGEHNQTDGFIPGYIRQVPFLAKTIRDKHSVEGIGACMGLRRSAWVALGGFDDRLGAGTKVGSGDELDFVFRALIAGYHVYETPEFSVKHNGFRTWEEAEDLIHIYMIGLGTVFGKYLRTNFFTILSIVPAYAKRWAFGRPAAEWGHLPSRLLRIAGFKRGLIGGFRIGHSRGTNPHLKRHAHS